MAIEQFLESNNEYIEDYFKIPTSFGVQVYFLPKANGLGKISLDSYVLNGGDLSLRPYDLKPNDFYVLKNNLVLLEDWLRE